MADEKGEVPAPFNDGSLEVTPVELLLPEEPELFLCVSLTESKRPLVVDGEEEEGKGKEKKEKEEREAEKEREDDSARKPLSPMSVDHPSGDAMEVGGDDEEEGEGFIPSKGKRKVEAERISQSSNGEKEEHSMEVDKQHPHHHHHHPHEADRGRSSVIDVKDNFEELRNSLITLMSPYSHRRPKRMRLEPQESQSPR